MESRVTPPAFEDPEGILARTAEAAPPLITEQIFSRLLRHRIIFLGQQVDEDIANRMCAEMVLLASEDEKRDISIYINSPGGSVYAGLAIYDVMQYVPNDIATYAMGMAASMGQFLLSAGHPWQALRAAARQRPDAPAVRRHRRDRVGHQDPGRADAVHQAHPGRAHRVPHRADASSRSRRTPTGTAGSPRTRPRSTASWTT